MSRLTIDLTDQQHKQLKAVAALEGKTIRQFATERLFPAKDKLDEDWERFKHFINKRIENAEKFGYSDRTIDDIFDEVLAEDEAA